MGARLLGGSIRPLQADALRSTRVLRTIARRAPPGSARASPAYLLCLPGDGELRLLLADLLRLLPGARRNRTPDNPLDPVVLRGAARAPRAAAGCTRRSLFTARLPHRVRRRSCR